MYTQACWAFYPIPLKQLHTLVFLPTDPVLKVTLAVSDLQKSLNYWSNLLGMKIYEQDEEKKRALLGYADDQVSDLQRNSLLAPLCLVHKSG